MDRSGRVSRIANLLYLLLQDQLHDLDRAYLSSAHFPHTLIPPIRLSGIHPEGHRARTATNSARSVRCDCR